MRVTTRFAVLVLGVAALVVFAATAGGCGGQAGGSADPQWERVLSTDVSGEAPVKLNLGDHQLGDRLRVAWTLTGPEDPPVTLTLRIMNVDNGGAYVAAVNAQTQQGGIPRRDDQAISLVLLPGEYRIFFGQRFPPARGPGYDIKMTIWTARTFTPSSSPAP